MYAANVGVQHVLCTKQFRLLLLGLNCVVPGASTLACNLVRNCDRPPGSTLRSQPWLSEYFLGAQQELYPVVFPPCTAGLTFQEVAIRLHRHVGPEGCGVVLLAVETVNGKVALCPLSKRLEPGKVGIVVARSDAVAAAAMDSLASFVGEAPSLRGADAVAPTSTAEGQDVVVGGFHE